MGLKNQLCFQEIATKKTLLTYSNKFQGTTPPQGGSCSSASVAVDQRCLLGDNFFQDKTDFFTAYGSKP